MAKKILLLGRAAAGKTSIKQVIFEGRDPNNLLKNPLSPTRGIESYPYKWMDLELGLFDTSGQELENLLKEESLQVNVFKSVDVIIYIAEYPRWEKDPAEFIEDIQKALKIIQDNAMNTRLILFLNKMDVVGEINPKTLKKIAKMLTEVLKLPGLPDIFFTSLSPEFIYSTYKAFSEILGGLSEEVFDLKEILDKSIEKSSKILHIIINLNNSIVVQSMTDDFDPKIIRDIYNKIAHKYLISENISSLIVKMQMVENQPMIIDIIKNTEEIHHPLIKNIISIYEDLDDKPMVNLMKNNIKKINKYSLKWAEKNLFVK